jgi:hypothetical protein
MPTHYTLVMHFHLVANVIIHKFNKENQVNPSPLALTLKGTDYQQRGKRNPSNQMVFLGKF